MGKGDLRGIFWESENRTSGAEISFILFQCRGITRACHARNPDSQSTERLVDFPVSECLLHRGSAACDFNELVGDLRLARSIVRQVELVKHLVCRLR